MNDVDDSDHELTDEQRDKLRKAIGEIIGDFTPWILCVGHHADNRGFTSVLFLERFKRARECLRAYRTNGIHKSRLPTVRSNQ